MIENVFDEVTDLTKYSEIHRLLQLVYILDWRSNIPKKDLVQVSALLQIHNTCNKSHNWLLMTTEGSTPFPTTSLQSTEALSCVFWR